MNSSSTNLLISPFSPRSSESRKKVLVVAPPYRLSQSGFPLGLMYVAGALQSAGHHVEVIDMDVLNLPMDDYIRELRERDYDYFCIGGMITAWNFIVFSVNLVKQIKPHVKTLVGGGIVSSTPLSLISNSKADAVCIGEGEETVLELIEAFEAGRSLDTVPGIAYRREDGVAVETQKRHYIDNLDILPYPAWELFKVGKTYTRYPSHHSLFKAKRVASIYTTRGCPFQCTFCYTEKTVRQRSIDNIIGEIKELQGRYGVQYLNISDDLFVVRKKRTIEFCEAMIKHKIKMQWSCTGRCNIVEPEFLKILKAAGCEFMGLGIESGSDSLLKAIKKSQTSKQIIEAVKMVQESGITPGGTFILGLPPENHETIRQTVETYKEINNYRSHVNRFFFATPYPGTELYTQMKAAGKIGDEIKFFEKISEHGDAVDFVINCTSAFGDEELRALKSKVEDEVFRDFMKKHPWSSFYSKVCDKISWSKIQNLLLEFKMKGFKHGVSFIWEKLMIKFKFKSDKHKRHWNKKQGYNSSQNMFEGHVVTF